jgi:S-adenosylmethionine/arginine decarboxylase-like enzyme
MIRSHHFSSVLPISAVIARATAPELLQLLNRVIEQADLTPFSAATATFEPQGISVVVILAESHVAIHIWPEEHQASVDIHVCDYHRNNRPRAERLAALLALQLTEGTDPTWHSLTINI